MGATATVALREVEHSGEKEQALRTGFKRIGNHAEKTA
jgi:hypothetical protein